MRHEWTTKDADSATAMVEKIKLVTEEAKHRPEIQIKDDKIVSADLLPISKGLFRILEYLLFAGVRRRGVTKTPCHEKLYFPSLIWKGQEQRLNHNCML